MSLCVCHGAVLQCPFGSNPSTLNVLPNSMTNVCNKPMATIMDNKPFVNIAIAYYSAILGKKQEVKPPFCPKSGKYRPPAAACN